MKPVLYLEAPRLPVEGSIQIRDLFPGRPGPVELEIGSALGGFLIERLRATPESLLVGLELRRKWACVSSEKLTTLDLSCRAQVFNEDARTILPRLVADSIRRVFVHFPDPWWKRRHAKRRLRSNDVLEAVARALEPGGELFIQTDVEDQALGYERLLAALPKFEPAVESGPRLADNPYGARSPRERRAQAEGLPIYRLLYRRRAL